MLNGFSIDINPLPVPFFVSNTLSDKLSVPSFGDRQYWLESQVQCLLREIGQISKPFLVSVLSNVKIQLRSHLRWWQGSREWGTNICPRGPMEQCSEWLQFLLLRAWVMCSGNSVSQRAWDEHTAGSAHELGSVTGRINHDCPLD